MQPAISLHRQDRDARAEVDPVMALHPGGRAAGGRAEGVIEGHATALDQRHRQVEFAADGSNLRTDEAAADDQNPTWTGG
jgi:hypothetical protein